MIFIVSDDGLAHLRIVCTPAWKDALSPPFLNGNYKIRIDLVDDPGKFIPGCMA
jgi:hypothetical protein